MMVVKKLTLLWFQTADIDEKGIRKEKPEELVMALAEAKVCKILQNNNNGIPNIT